MIRRLFAASLVLFLGTACSSTPVPEISQSRPFSDKDIAETIQYIEKRIVLPKEALPLSRYARYYAVESDGIDMIRATYVVADAYMPVAPGIYITSYDQHPSIADAGCDTIVHVRYTVGYGLKVFCKGYIPPPPE